MLWFFGKLFAVLFVFIWLRGTLPRLRYDQFMKFGWKVLIPVSLIWIMVEAAIKVLDRQAAHLRHRRHCGPDRHRVVRLRQRAAEEAGAARRDSTAAGLAPFDPYAGGFPVPPMPGQQLPSRRPVRVGIAPEAPPRRPDDDPSDTEVIDG